MEKSKQNFWLTQYHQEKGSSRVASNRAWVQKYTLRKHEFEKDSLRASHVDQFTVLGLKEMLRSLRVWTPKLLLQGWKKVGRAGSFTKASPRLGQVNTHGDLSHVCLCPMGSPIPSPTRKLFNYHLLWKVVQGQR